VKQFDKDPIAWMRETGQGGFIDEHKPVRGAVKQAAGQLRPLKGGGLPLVVVLANPNGYHVELSGEQVIHALYGDDTLVFTVWTGEGPPPPDFPTRRATSASSGATARSALPVSTSARS